MQYGHDSSSMINLNILIKNIKINIGNPNIAISVGDINFL